MNMNGLRGVYVLGVGQSKFGRFKGVDPILHGVAAANEAINDAGIDPRKFETAYGSRVLDATQTIQNIMKRVGVAGIPMMNVENACASGATAVHSLVKDIAYGVYDVGIAVGCESMTTSSKSGKLVGVAEGDLNGILGITMPALGGFGGNLYLERYGATEADLAYPSIKNHKNAVDNPYAAFQKVITLEDILNSKMICSPIRTLHCCPVTDGGAAVILCTEAIAKQYTTKLVKIAASSLMTSYYADSTVDMMTYPSIRDCAQQAYNASGVSPQDLDLIELHDAFAPEEIGMCSVLGLCKPGDEISYLRSGALERDGKSPMNPSGGLQSLGHPLGASGVRVVAEVASHLRGTASGRQVMGAKVGMAQMVGGYLTGLMDTSANTIHIMTT